jgi:hypothetical protein
MPYDFPAFSAIDVKNWLAAAYLSGPQQNAATPPIGLPALFREMIDLGQRQHF